MKMIVDGSELNRQEKVVYIFTDHGLRSFLVTAVAPSSTIQPQT